MKSLWVMSWWLVVLVAGGLQAATPLQTLKNCRLLPTEWADGDSFRVRTADQREITVRLYGVDCVEWHVNDDTDERRLRTQRRYFGITNAAPDARAAIALAKGFGEAAGAEVRRLLARPFTIHTSFADARGDARHQRVYAFVVTADGADLGAHLVARGLARAFGVLREAYDGRRQDDYRESLGDLELQAAKRGVGIWAKTNWDSLIAERETQRREEQEISLALDDQALAPGDTINPNTATRDALMRLPGIGEEMANRLIANRPYRTQQDLRRVPGLGPATLKKLQPHLDLPVQ